MCVCGSPASTGLVYWLSSDVALRSDRVPQTLPRPSRSLRVVRFRRATRLVHDHGQYGRGRRPRGHSRVVSVSGDPTDRRCFTVWRNVLYGSCGLFKSLGYCVVFLHNNFFASLQSYKYNFFACFFSVFVQKVSAHFDTALRLVSSPSMTSLFSSKAYSNTLLPDVAQMLGQCKATNHPLSRRTFLGWPRIRVSES